VRLARFPEYIQDTQEDGVAVFFALSRRPHGSPARWGVPALRDGDCPPSSNASNAQMLHGPG
jgi:hypothetical protein